jgi:hypothetical protein
MDDTFGKPTRIAGAEQPTAGRASGKTAVETNARRVIRFDRDRRFMAAFLLGPLCLHLFSGWSGCKVLSRALRKCEIFGGT